MSNQMFILLLLALPILIKFFLDKTVQGKCSKYYGRLPVIGSMEGIIHFIQGLIFGLSNKLSSKYPWLLSTTTIFGVIYPTYNLVKRTKKHYNVFSESSFYLNSLDFLIGYISAEIIYKIFLTKYKGDETQIYKTFQKFLTIYIGLLSIFPTAILFIQSKDISC